MSSAPRAARRIVVTGAGGQLGWELLRCLAPLGEVIGTVRRHPAAGQAQLDLAAPAQLGTALRELRPDVVVNAAAYTAVDAAEDDPDTARAVNADAVAELARSCAGRGATLVHFSTDYVFDGRSSRPYTEQDRPAPLGVYGVTKLAGEQAARSLAPRHLVLRSSWVYGLRGKNFVQTMLRLGGSDVPLRVVADQYGTPTWSRLLAAFTAQLLGRDADWLAERSGLYHVCAPDHASWHQLACRAIERCHGAPRAAAVQAIATADYPTAARRPAWSVMDPGLAHRTFGLSLPPWGRQLDLMLDDRGPACD